LLNKFLISSIIILFAFIVLALIVSPKTNSGNNYVVNLDKIAYLDVNNYHYPTINQLMIYLTLYGRELFWVLTIIILFIFGGSAGKKTAIVLSIVILVLIPIGIIAKEVIERHRPVIPSTDFLIPADSEFSFPSGHAFIVSAGAAIVLTLFRDSNRKLAISLFLSIEAGLVCISRVYVGGHYPLDVIGGIFLGVGISFLFLWKEKKLISKFSMLRNRLNIQDK
jgi:membrane-associated phospholipid phosphatase